MLDVVNCFQNTINDISRRAHASLLPFCLYWFKSRHPQHRLPSGVKLIAKALSAMQGQRGARNPWRKRLQSILQDLQMKRCNSDHGLFVISSSTSKTLILFISTDGALVGHNDRTLVDKLLTTIKMRLSFMKGPLLNF